MKNIVKLSILCGCISILSTFPAKGQWVGPDPSVIFHDQPDAPKVSATFRVEAFAVLDAIDALNDKAGKAEESDDARGVLLRTLTSLNTDYKNVLEVLYGTNLRILAHTAYIDSIYYPAEQISGGGNRSSTLRHNSLLSLLVSEECSRDLRLRLTGTGNPKCQDVSNHLKAVAIRGWIGPGDGIHDENPLVMKSQDHRTLAIEALDLTDIAIEKLSATPEVSQEERDQVTEGLLKAMARLSIFTAAAIDPNEIVFFVNAEIRLRIAMLDAVRYQLDQRTAVNRLYWDNLALEADHACVNDIRQRLLGKSDLSCVRLLKGLNGLK